MTITSLLRESAKKLAQISETPALDAEVLLAHALGVNKEYLFAHGKNEIPSLAQDTADRFIDQRLQHVPVAYITGEKEFFNRTFIVNPSVLIPRPETELLVERALFWIQKLSDSKKINRSLSVVDMGTGSGCIAATIAREVSPTTPINIVASDASTEAAEIARENFKRLGVEKKITLVQSDLLESITMPLELIVANLPYVSEQEYRQLAPDLFREPRTALVSGKNGLAHYIRLLQQIKKTHPETRVLLCEISLQQNREFKLNVRRLFPTATTNIHKDISGKNRCAEIVFYA